MRASGHGHHLGGHLGAFNANSNVAIDDARELEISGRSTAHCFTNGGWRPSSLPNNLANQHTSGVAGYDRFDSLTVI